MHVLSDIKYSVEQTILKRQVHEDCEG